PYYLTFRAEKAGYHPEIILAGRRINDGMGERIARECMRALLRRGRANPTVTILGMTFKENVPDIRNSKVIDILRELERVGISVQVADPIASAEETAREYGIKLTPLESLPAADAIILAVAHKEYVARGWPLVSKLLKDRQGIVLDVKAKLDRAKKPDGIDLWRLQAATGVRTQSMTDGPILVTGAAGFIGFHVARGLLRNGRDVVGVDNMNAYYDPALKESRRAELAKSNRLRFVKLDLADRNGVASLFEEHR